MEPQTNSQISISILFVEDDELILDLQASVLMDKFPDVVFYTAVNGRLGLELFKEHEQDIVITDINMSVMCGVQMSSNIRAIKPDTKFIAITGKSEKLIQHTNNDNKFEFDHIIVKPVDLSELFVVVEQCISEIKQQV